MDAGFARGPAATPDDAIATDRLLLRRPHPTDAAPVAALMTPGVSRWLASWPSPMSPEAAAQRIGDACRSVDAGEALHFVIERRADWTVMGWIGVRRIASEPGRGDLGYWLGEAFHKQGYASEAARAAVAAGFNRLGLASIEAGAQSGNDASFALMRGLGMQPAGEQVVCASARTRDERCTFFAVAAEQFAQVTSSPRGRRQ